MAVLDLQIAVRKWKRRITSKRIEKHMRGCYEVFVSTFCRPGGLAVRDPRHNNSMHPDLSHCSETFSLIVQSCWLFTGIQKRYPSLVRWKLQTVQIGFGCLNERRRKRFSGSG
jgi:hypothetical protein